MKPRPNDRLKEGGGNSQSFLLHFVSLGNDWEFCYRVSKLWLPSKIKERDLRALERTDINAILDSYYQNTKGFTYIRHFVFLNPSP